MKFGDIEKGIPFPDRRPGSKGSTGLVETLRKMEVGDSLFVAVRSRRNISSSFAGLFRIGRKFTATPEGEGIRVWRTE